jgi:endonuclease III related protein
MSPMSTTGKLLREMYEAMLARFSHQGWWPGDTPLEMCVGAILTQNTNWGNAAKALVNLKAAARMSVTALHNTSHEELAELIRPAGYYNIKAKRLKNFIAHVHRGWGDDIVAFLDRSISTLREELLSINGIGLETADSIILYAAGKPTFVVDAYTARILLRHQLIYPEAMYEEIKDVFESNLAADAELFNDYHAQLVAVGKNFCRPTARCEGCPLEGFPHDRFAGRGEE